MHRRLLAWICGLPLLVVTSCGSDAAAPGVATPIGETPSGEKCLSDAQCASGACRNGVCTAKTTVTGDAGEDTPDPSRPGCTSDDQCPSKACGDDGKCASAKSCVRARGGRTCGPNGNDDCCAIAMQGTTKLDKYLVTAGRMRAFVEKTQGNVQGFVDSLGDKWKPEWNDADSLPTDIASANVLLGPYGSKKACSTGDDTGHSYWTPPDGNESSDLDQDTLDDKALNCVPWPMLQALCAWDGGHIANLAELKAAFTNNGTTKYPWGDKGLASVNSADPEQRLNIEYGYETSPLPATYRKRGDGRPAGVTFFISPPGRFPNGINHAGVADAAGDLLEWVGDRKRQFVWKADFEHHASNAAAFNGGNWWWESQLGQPWIWGTNQLFGQAGNNGERNGYYSIGGRCAY